MHIAVAGGTGTVGSRITAVARARGHHVTLLTRSAGLDLLQGAPRVLAGALEGVDAVVDATSVATARRSTAESFFGTVTGNLMAAEASAGVGHHVCLSIVGIDEIPFGYYQGKLRQEDLVQHGPVPWTVLRATQFHEFAAQTLERSAVGPVVLVPRMLSQPVAAVEVAAAVVDLAEQPPAGRVADVAGPEPLEMVDLVRALAQARGLRRPVVGLTLPGAAARAMRTGALLPEADGPRGATTFRAWLDGQRNS